MFEICLFDLDDTLIRTADLKQVREACKNNSNPLNLRKLIVGLASQPDRFIFDLELLYRIRSAFPTLNLGIFTRSPRSYVITVLQWAYPNFNWDIIVAYEDVKQTKPHGEGIDKAMYAFGVTQLDKVLLVGDTDIDVRASYNCGCVIALTVSAWPKKREYDHWKALEHVPDAIISAPDELLDVLDNPAAYLPELERLLDGDGAEQTRGVHRFDKINHFISKTADNDSTPYPIYVAGRSFSNYPSICYRKQWHSLTASIAANKESDNFPEEWIFTIRHFIAQKCNTFFSVANVVVTVVPHRPGRKARLEKLLTQLTRSIADEPIKNCVVICQPELLSYREGVKSQHNDFLNRDARFVNVRDHLVVQHPELVKARTFYVAIDDVTTTGASLIYTSKYLKLAGATEVKCLSMAKNIGDVL